jgi:hypothetical protein
MGSLSSMRRQYGKEKGTRLWKCLAEMAVARLRGLLTHTTDKPTRNQRERLLAKLEKQLATL